MVKGEYKISSRTRMELLNSNIWWMEGWNFLSKDSLKIKVFIFIAKGYGT